MSILKQISNLKLSNNTLINLTDTEIIRIEKKLKSKVLFDEDLTINDVELIVELLKNNLIELEFLSNNCFKNFRQILEHPSQLIVFDDTHSFTINCTDKFIEFIETYFQKEIDLYINNCIKEMHYKALFLFLKYQSVLNVETIDNCLTLLTKKVEFAWSAIDINTTHDFSKFVYVANPYFYKSLSQIGSLHFEESIDIIINSTVEKIDTHRFYYRILFALGSFKSSNNESNSLLTGNKEVAIENGVVELIYINRTNKDKGDTRFKSFFAIFKKNQKLAPGILQFYLTFILLIIILIVIIKFSNTSTKRSHTHNIYETSTLKSDTDLNNSTPFQNEITKILNNQSPRFKIQFVKPLDYTKDIVNYFEPLIRFETEKSITILNKLNQSVVILVKPNSGNIYKQFIPPNSSIKLKDYVKYLSFYTGKTPEIITGNDKSGASISCFRFREFNTESLKLLDIMIKNDAKFDITYTIEINQNKLIEIN